MVCKTPNGERRIWTWNPSVLEVKSRRFRNETPQDWTWNPNGLDMNSEGFGLKSKRFGSDIQMAWHFAIIDLSVTHLPWARIIYRRFCSTTCSIPKIDPGWPFLRFNRCRNVKLFLDSTCPLWCAVCIGHLMCVVSVLITSYRSASVQKESELPNMVAEHWRSRAKTRGRCWKGQ